MENIIIRRAEPGDLETLFAFEQGIIATERPFDPTLKEGEIHYYDLEKMIFAADVEIVVAEMSGQVIGSGYARIEESKPYLKHPRHGYLGFMYVRPEYRGRGVNNLVLNALKEWATLQGLTELRLEVYNSNNPALKAYEKAGFTPYLLQMRMGL